VPRRTTPKGRAEAYVAFVRAINLGGHNRVPMPELRAVVTGLGAHGVETYLQSGNVVFSTGDAPEGLAAAVEEGIAGRLGLRVTVIVRSRPALRALVGANPFVRRGLDPAFMHATLLALPPAPVRVMGLSPPNGSADEFALAGADVYLFCPGGYGRTKLTNAWFERRLGVEATTRNWRTILAVTEMAGA
jgi:uncharacterized protein (DUF1697 family)